MMRELVFKKFNWILSVVCLIQLAGCVVIKGEYFEPSGDDGIAVLSDCDGVAGLRSSYNFEKGELKGYLRADISELDSNLININLVLQLPKKSEVIVSENQVEVITGSAKSVHSFTEIVAFNLGKLGSADVTHKRKLDGSQYNGYKFYVSFPMKKDKFTLIFPEFLIGEDSVQLKPIVFLKKSGWGMLPLNC